MKGISIIEAVGCGLLKKSNTVILVLNFCPVTASTFDASTVMFVVARILSLRRNLLFTILFQRSMWLVLFNRFPSLSHRIIKSGDPLAVTANSGLPCSFVVYTTGVVNSGGSIVKHIKQ